MGASVGKKGGRRQMNEINVTPLVDVMLVLMIIFMVAAPLLTASVEVNLPESSAAPVQQPEKPPLIVSIKASGDLYVGEDRINPQQFIAKLQAAQTDTSQAIFLRADESLDYGIVMQTMGQLNKAGFKKISLISEQLSE